MILQGDFGVFLDIIKNIGVNFEMLVKKNLINDQFSELSEYSVKSTPSF